MLEPVNRHSHLFLVQVRRTPNRLNLHSVLVLHLPYEYLRIDQFLEIKILGFINGTSVITREVTQTEVQVRVLFQCPVRIHLINTYYCLLLEQLVYIPLVVLKLKGIG